MAPLSTSPLDSRQADNDNPTPPAAPSDDSQHTDPRKDMTADMTVQSQGPTGAGGTPDPSPPSASGQKVSVPISIPEEELLKLHRFWDSQPVPRVADDIPSQCGPIERKKTVEEVRKEPYNLPPAYEWCTLDVQDDADMSQLFKLLEEHYVEDDDACFRFSYSKDCLKWALTPPGFRRDWHIGVRANGILFAFISGIPALMHVHDEDIDMAIVNFLCVHKKLRSKRLAPVLIKEVTRRVNLENVWQAVYTAGSFLPRPVGECQYFHRPLDIRKLVDIGFSRLQGRQTMNIAERLYSLPTEQPTQGIRPMRLDDIPIVTKLLEEDFAKRNVKLHQVMSELDVRHWLLPREEVIYSYVIDKPEGGVRDFFSFYYLPSNVIRYNTHHKLLRAVYNFYSVASSMSSKELMYEALREAHRMKFDVYNALELGDNRSSFKDPKFGPGDATLRYYLYNWNCPPVDSQQVGLILL